MAEFRTNSNEELCIERVRKDGCGYTEALGFSDNDFPKYLVLRVALAKALRSVKFPLDSQQWDAKKIAGEKGKEYNLEQLTGKGKSKNEDFDMLFRSLLYIQHKDELDAKGIDIFNDDKEFADILGKYIRRGLYEIHNSWKSSDCFYQWCLDNLEFSFATTREKDNSASNTMEYFERLQKYFKNFAIHINLINEEDSYRHHICKIELNDSSKIAHFESKAKQLDRELGQNVMIEPCESLSKTYNIQIAKPTNAWQNLGFAEFKSGLNELKKRDDKLGVYAGNDIEKIPFCFDLAEAPHCFVAGTSGSGKTKFIQTMIVCLLQKSNVEIVVIDPKQGIDFKVFGTKITLITDRQKVSDFIDTFIEEMHERNAQMSDFGADIQALGFHFKVLIVDELNNLIENDKSIKDKLSRLAEMARQAGIHLVLGTQRPDGTLLKGLRNNIDGKIALRVDRGSESKIILDESGAEKLLGKGDMLVKFGNMSKPKHIFGVKLEDDEIKSLI